MEQEMRESRLSDYSPACFGMMLLRNLWMIAAAAAICAMGASLYLSWLRPPVYQASMTYAVSSRMRDYTSASNISASTEVTAVMIELIQTDVIAEKLREAEPALAEFEGSITAAQVGETNLMTVTARAESPELAFRALDTLTEIFPELSDYISRYHVATLIRNPVVSAAPVNGLNRRELMGKAALIGAALMAALLCWVCAIRETVQTRSGARRLLDAPIVAVVGHERKNRTIRAALRRATRGLQVFAPTTSFAYTEQINRICTRLEQENAGRELRVFLVASVGENEGKSTIAGNVAAMLAMKGRRVALIDGDLRKPAMHKFFDGVYHSDQPLNALLSQPVTAERLEACLRVHPKLGVSMLFADKPEKRSMQLLSGPNMRALLRSLSDYDFVIVDTPPMGFFPDAEAMAPLVDATMLVVRRDYTPACDINDAVDTLRQSGSRFLGCVLNDMERSEFGGAYGDQTSERRGR